jgi:hypothetical protein
VLLRRDRERERENESERGKEGTGVRILGREETVCLCANWPWRG